MLISIFLTIILPIFLLIGIGVALDRRLHLDMPTLSRLNFYVFVPALSFVKLLEADVSAGQMLTLGVFAVAHLLVLFALSWVLFSHRALRKHQTALCLGTLFYNAGNYGIPLVLLAFGDRQIGVLATLLVVQNFLNFTLGIWLLERKVRGAGKVLAGMLKVPVVYAVIAALVVRAFDLPLPAQIRGPVTYLADGLVPVALLTLGVQVSRTRLDGRALALSAVSAMRLVVSPLVAALLVVPFGFTGATAAVLIVSAGFPVAVNVFLLAAEYRQDEELASQSILLTTLASGVTLAVLLALVK